MKSRSKPKGRIAAIREAWEAGTLEIELTRGSFSIYERQSILAVTSDGRRAGRLPVGHHDDSRGRFRPDQEDSDGPPRVIRWRPDEAVSVEEQAALNAVVRWRVVLESPEGRLAAAVIGGLTGVSDFAASELAALELGVSSRQLRSRIESGNRKVQRRAERLAEELVAEDPVDESAGDEE